MAKRIRVIYPVWVPEEVLAEDVAMQIPQEFIRRASRWSLPAYAAVRLFTTAIMNLR